MAAVAQDIKDLTPKEYQDIRKLVYEKSGINLGEHKIQLVRARLGKLVRKGGYSSFGDYLGRVKKDESGQMLGNMLDAISTNTTHLFREIRHFQLLAKLIEEWAGDSTWRARHRTLRIWCAASSSGEEPYSIAMVAHDAVRNHNDLDVKILATDISTEMLNRAQRGIFEEDRVHTVPEQFRKRYLKKVSSEHGTGLQATPDVRSLIKFARFNLMTPTFPFKNPFNIIFCRNVMIYFDAPTQETLVNKFAQHLHPGGYLLIGHSESLNSLRHPYTYAEPTVYRK